MTLRHKRKLRKIFLKAESMGTSLAEAFGVFDKDGSGFVTAAELEEGLRGLGVFDAIPKEQVIAQLLHAHKHYNSPPRLPPSPSKTTRTFRVGAKKLKKVTP